VAKQPAVRVLELVDAAARVDQHQARLGRTALPKG